MDYLNEKLRPLIEKHGHAVQAVAGRSEIYAKSSDLIADDELFAYTVGLADRDLPEVLLIAPLAPRMQFDLLNTVAAGLKEGSIAGPGDYPNIIERFTIRLREISVPVFREYAFFAFAWAETKGRTVANALQFRLPDEHGRFPDESGYTWAPVPVLAPPPAVSPASDRSTQKQRADASNN
jgi:hypothetical protein